MGELQVEPAVQNTVVLWDTYLLGLLQPLYTYFTNPCGSTVPKWTNTFGTHYASCYLAGRVCVSYTAYAHTCIPCSLDNSGTLSIFMSFVMCEVVCTNKELLSQKILGDF